MTKHSIRKSKDQNISFDTICSQMKRLKLSKTDKISEERELQRKLSEKHFITKERKLFKHPTLPKIDEEPNEENENYISPPNSPDSPINRNSYCLIMKFLNSLFDPDVYNVEQIIDEKNIEN